MDEMDDPRQSLYFRLRDAGRTPEQAQLVVDRVFTPPPEPEPPSRGLTIARELSQGATLGLGDEIAGLVSGADTREAEREALAQGRQAYPGTAMAANLAGGLAAGGAMGGVRALAARPFLSATLAGATQGAGAADAGVGEAIKGAGMGGAFGLLAAGAGTVAGKAGRELARRTGLSDALETGLTRVAGPSPTARIGSSGVGRGQANVVRALTRDAATPDVLAARLAEAERLGKPAVLADVAGTNAQEALDIANLLPSEAADAVRTFATGRAGARLERMGQDVASGLNVRQFAEREAARRGEAAAASYAQLADFAPLSKARAAQAQRLLTTPSGRDAAAAAARTLADEGITFDPRNLEHLHRVRSELANMASGKPVAVMPGQAGGAGRPSPTGQRALRGLVERMDALMDDATDGAYAAMRDEFAANSRPLQAALAAVGQGKDKTWKGTKAFLRLGDEEFATVMATAQRDPAAWDAYRQAARTNVADALMTPGRNGASVARSLMENPKLQARVQALFDTPAEANDWLARTLLEARMRGTEVGLGNSKTARRLLGASDAFGPEGIGGAAADAAVSPVAGAGRALLALAARAGATRNDERTANEMVRLLLAGRAGGTPAPEAVATARATQQALAERARRSAAVRAGLGVIGGAAAGSMRLSAAPQ
jgi:hypothetical protein